MSDEISTLVERFVNREVEAATRPMRELLSLILAEVETECTCDASREKCLHCRITECLEGK